ncbi:hypothetical protein OT109_04270 [Phycisphaeraceae bacterium D3-23]
MVDPNREWESATPGDPAPTPNRLAALGRGLDAGYLRLRHKLCCTREKLLARRGTRQRILFSNHDGWEKPIRLGFENTGHHIHFDRFTPESVRGYDMVVPLSIEDALFMDGNPDLLPDNPLPIPSAKAIAICDDKVRFHQTLTELGYSAYLPPMEGELGYPHILKKKVDQWGQSCVVIHNPRQEAEHQNLLQTPDYFRQRMVPGYDEYATHMLMKNGRLLRDLNIRYHFNTPTPIKGQDTIAWMRRCPSTHRERFVKILKDLDYDGLCCFNYKHDEQGQPLIFEINPRFGGSLSRYFFGFVRHLCR